MCSIPAMGPVSKSAETVWSVGSTVSKPAATLLSASAGTTMRSAPRRLKPTDMLASMLRNSTAPANTIAQLTATAAASSAVRNFRRAIFCKARPGGTQRDRIPSQRARAGLLHMRYFGRDNYTIMMPAGTRQYPDQAVSGGLDHRDSARKALETAKRRQHVFAVI